MNINLTGRRALVGGASSGIGGAAAQELALLGAEVTLLARSREALEQMRSRMANPERHGILTADAAHPAALSAAVAQDITEHGPLQILVNNTGGPPGGPVGDASAEEFLRAFTQHLLANHALAQACLPGMKAAGYGRIINVISTSVKAPIPGLGVSNTVRAAVANWAKTLSAEVARFGITVNNILPGATDTPRLNEIFAARAARQNLPLDEVVAHEKDAIPARRFARPEEIAAAIAFLASPAAAYINGVNLPVDGGRTPSL